MTLANRRIDTAAAEWAARLRTRPLSPEEEGHLERWLAENERHRGAFLRARALSSSVDRLASLAGHGRRSEPRGPWSSSVLVRFGIAASVAIVLICALAWWRWPVGTSYATAVGGIESIRLGDGSQVTLNTDTRIRVDLADRERRIELDQGEALFEVAKDASRPFIVRTGPVSVRAVGTVFAVNVAEDRVDVTVTEGAVELTDSAGPDGSLVRRVSANESATVFQKRQIEVRRIAADAAERQLAWRVRMIEFSGEPLGRAVQQINRHNKVRIVVDDLGLAEHPIVGNFRVDDPAGFAETVAVAIGARAAREGDAIHLRPRGPAQPPRL